jgi:hypothetical protein
MQTSQRLVNVSIVCGAKVTVPPVTVPSSAVPPLQKAGALCYSTRTAVYVDRLYREQENMQNG